MALSITEPVANINSSTDSLTYSFASFTPAAGTRLVVHFVVYGHSNDSGSVSDSGIGLTWTKRDSTLFNVSGATIYAFESSIVPGSPAATVITLTMTGGTPTGCCATCWQIEGNTPTFVQKKSVANGSGGTASVTMDAALNTNNCYVLGAGNTSNPPNWTPPTSWTETFDNGHPSSEGGYSAFRVNGESGTTVTMGSATPSNWGMHVLEYAESGGTLYTQSAGGTSTNSGALPTVSVSLNSLAGSSLNSGSILKKDIHTFAGASTNSGAVSNVLISGGGSTLFTLGLDGISTNNGVLSTRKIGQGGGLTGQLTTKFWLRRRLQ